MPYRFNVPFTIPSLQAPLMGWLALLFLSTNVWAQQDSIATQRQFQPIRKSKVDSFQLADFYASDPNTFLPISDTSLAQFHQYRPTQQQSGEYADLGIIGSAYRPIYYQASQRRGFDFGYHQFDLYYVLPETFRFSQLNQPFLQASFVQGAAQEDNFFRLRFNRNFAKGIQLALETKRVSQQGALHYNKQALRNEGFGIGLAYDAPSGRYDGYLSFSSNTTIQSENGGVAIIPEQGGTFSGHPSAATIVLVDSFGRSGESATRHAQRNIRYTHYLQLRPLKDSLDQNKRAFTLGHRIGYDSKTYKFFDDAPLADYYQQFAVDERGLRHFVKIASFENTFTISTYRKTSNINLQDSKLRDRIEFGIAHAIHQVDQEITDSTIQNLFLTGRIDFQLKDKLTLQTNAHLGLLDHAGDYLVAGKLFSDLKKLGQLSLQAQSQAYEPSLLKERFYVSQQSLWKHDWKKTFENNLTATYHLPKLKLEVSAGYHLLTNAIYFDTLAAPQQTEESISIGQVHIAHELQLGKLHLVNQIALQQASSEIIRLPSWTSTHRLYVTGKLFKQALDFQAGLDLRMTKSYRALYYQPLVGQFQLQNTAAIPFYPALDAYLSIKVKTFRAFVKAENLTHLLNDYYYEYYQTYRYNQLPFFVSFGIDWRFFN